MAVAERKRKKRKMHGIPFAPEQERHGGGEVINQAHTPVSWRGGKIKHRQNGGQTVGSRCGTRKKGLEAKHSVSARMC